MASIRASRFFIWLEAILCLGIKSVGRVALYRLGVRAGLNPVRRLRAKPATGPFFLLKTKWRDDLAGKLECAKYSEIFGWHKVYLFGSPPDWLQHIESGNKARNDLPWWRIPDFDLALGDVKGIWELSRFEWALKFARNFLVDPVNRARHINWLNEWLADWCKKNPPYFGPNWKCGQEASFRVLHLAITAILLGQFENTSKSLLDFIRTHLRRIEPTLSYAIGQDNNHGTSEAAALFVGSSWLQLNGRYDRETRRWSSKGRYWLEERVDALIDDEGSFSQYSTNYHRVLVDTLSIVEVVRRRARVEKFSDAFYGRAKAAIEWLYTFLIPENGRVSNIGANDGAHLMALALTPYEDYRPSVQLAALIFFDSRAIMQPGPWDEPALLLGLASPEHTEPILTASRFRNFSKGGYVVIRNDERTHLTLRYPRYRFRPSHADALHVDLWRNGKNLLRDGGSYSYSDLDAVEYFSGIKAHNSIELDDRDQMPKLSRFLYGRWLQATEAKVDPIEGGFSVTAGYNDWLGGYHQRILVLKNDELLVTDEVKGFKQRAVLRWRLPPGAWKLEGNRLTGEVLIAEFCASMPIVRLEICEGYESLHYLRKSKIPVIELEIANPGRITSRFLFLDA